ncbi:MAG TPA: DUF6069 family protein [Streptosporangiaceae bacterium]
MPSTVLDRAMTLARVDVNPPHRGPHPAAAAAGTVISVGLCLLADALLARAGTWLFPSTRGYVHFQFSDYAKLTVIGVVIAGLAWPVVVRVSRDPRWVYAWLAVLVTVVLLLPDAYIWLAGQPGRAVLVLVAMHLAIALITYHVLVRVAPPRRRRASV